MTFADDDNSVWYDDQGRPHITVAPGAPIGPNQGGTNQLPTELPVEQFEPSTPITPGPINKLYDIMTGGNGQERYQLFPERIVRSALSLPTDVMSGKVQTPVVSPSVPIEDTSQDELLQRVQDMAALMGGGGIGMAEKGALGTAGGKLFQKVTGPVESHPDYVYHATNIENANAIAEGGSLNLHKPNEFTDQDIWPDGSTQKRNYFTPTAQNTWQFAPEQGEPVLLRIKKSDHPFKKESTGDIYSTKSVPASKIEYLDQTGKWNILKSDNEAAAPIAALENAPVFHSAVENAVNTASLKSAPAQQWLSTISNAKGVKPEELDWTGLKDFLQEQKGPVSKEQIQQHLEGNKVELKEVNKDTGVSDIYTVIDQNGNQRGHFSSKEKAEEYLKNAPDFIDKANSKISPVVLDSTKYSKYQLPGGENYREKLLTLPIQKLSIEEAGKNLYEHFVRKGGEQHWEQLDPNTRQHWQERASEQGQGLNYSDMYKSSHWDEPNVLAHIRMNDRTIEGKKALHIEEIQSDWHQQGREQGYKITDAQKKQLESIDNKLTSKLSEGDIDNPDTDAVLKTAVDKKVITSAEASNYKQWSKGENSNIPDAPFKKTWLDLAAKRMIREAAEKGMDRLSWTPGEAQAARYDLSKQVDGIRARRRKDGTFDLVAKKKGEEDYLNHIASNIPVDKLSDHVGKELGEKIADQVLDEKEYKGLDLKVGGEGMHYFYDKMLPSVLEKLTGQKMKVGNISSPAKMSAKGEVMPQDGGGWKIQWDDGTFSGGYGNRNNAEVALRLRAKTIEAQNNKQPDKINYIDLPQSVKDTALHKGFPLFSSGLMLNPVEDNPFARSKYKLVPVKEQPKFK